MPKSEKKEIGLAVIGCGTIGRIRAKLARDYPGVGWIGLCDLKSDLGEKLKDDVDADFFTNDFKELLARPEVTAVIVATDENFHTAPTLVAAERGHDLFIEKPLATDANESARVLAAIEAAGVDAVIGYTQRFRRRFLAVKERLITGPDRRCPLGRHPRLHEPHGADRHGPAHPGAGDAHAHGGLRHPQPGYVALADGGEDAGVGLRQLDGQGAG